MPVSRRRKSGKEKVNADRLQKQKEKSAEKKRKIKSPGHIFTSIGAVSKEQLRGATKHIGAIDEVADFEEQK